MGIFENLGHVIEQARSGQASESDVHGAYDQVAQAVPQDTMAQGLAHAFRSSETAPFPQIVSQLFGRSNPDQKAGVLNTLLSHLGPGERGTALGTAAGVVGTGQVTPQQAQQLQPQQVEQLARHAEQKDGGVVDQAAQFYTQHPTLVKSLGLGALTLVLAHMSPLRH